MKEVKFYKGLRFKIILGLIGLLTLTMTILFTLQYFQHRKKMIYNLQENISPHLTQMVNDVLKSSMLSKNKDEMKHILEAVHQYPDVKNIFILNRTGRIIISTNDKEVGRIIDIRDPTCQVCHRGATKALNKTVIYSSPGGEKIFRNVNPIYNQKECFSCHKPEEKITGVLVTDFFMICGSIKSASGVTTAPWKKSVDPLSSAPDISFPLFRVSTILNSCTDSTS